MQRNGASNLITWIITIIILALLVFFLRKPITNTWNRWQENRSRRSPQPSAPLVIVPSSTPTPAPTATPTATPAPTSTPQPSFTPYAGIDEDLPQTGPEMALLIPALGAGIGGAGYYLNAKRKNRSSKRKIDIL